MTEVQTEQIKTKRKYTKKAKPAEKKESIFSGLTANDCPSACTEKKCVISTVNVCKHPCKSSDSGCGPVTMANREKARKLIKHQFVDIKG